MLNNILNLEGVQVLSTNEQKTVSGAGSTCKTMQCKLNEVLLQNAKMIRDRMRRQAIVDAIRRRNGMH
jgi:hypothetical protein